MLILLGLIAPCAPVQVVLGAVPAGPAAGAVRGLLPARRLLAAAAAGGAASPVPAGGGPAATPQAAAGTPFTARGTATSQPAATPLRRLPKNFRFEDCIDRDSETDQVGSRLGLLGAVAGAVVWL